MDARAAQKLADRGYAEPTAAGAQAVRVSLQYRQPLEERSRAARRQQLQTAFERIAELLRTEGADVDLESISTSGQTVEALLPLDSFDELSERLSEEDIRVDPLIDRQVV